MLDLGKCYLRNPKGKSTEYLVVGFIERLSGRSRAYLVPNIKVQTIALVISKTVEAKSILYTPFYHES